MEYSNPCIRCGKQRVKSKEWKEKITTFWGTSEILHEETVCTDPECQKIVDKRLKEARDKKELLEMEREKRIKKSRDKRSGLHFSKRVSKS